MQILLFSIAKDEDSRIVSFLKKRTGMVTTRSHIQYIIVENGITNLYGKKPQKRATELVKWYIQSIRNGLRGNIVI